MRTRSPLITLGVSAALALSLTSCLGKDDDKKADTAAPAAQQQSPAASAPAAGSAGGAGAGAASDKPSSPSAKSAAPGGSSVTGGSKGEPPAQEYKFGQPAKVTNKLYQVGPATIDMAPVDIREGAMADLTAAGYVLEDKSTDPNSLKPYYVTTEYSNTSGKDLAYATGFFVSVIDSSGKTTKWADIPSRNKFSKCPFMSMQNFQPGVKVKGCDVFLLPKDVQITGFSTKSYVDENTKQLVTWMK